MNNMQPNRPFPDETDLHAYIDGRLDEHDRARMEAWLARHPDQAAALHGWQNDAQVLRAEFGGWPTSANPTALDPGMLRARHRQRVRQRCMLAALLVLALLTGGIGGWQARSMPSITQAAPMADALQAYRLFALDRDASLDVTQEQAGSLQTWLDRYLPNAPLLPDLKASGFHLVGGRLLANAAGPAALVLYRNARGEAISFYIRSPASATGKLVRGQRREGRLATRYGSSNGYNYALVGLANQADLQALHRVPGYAPRP